MAKIKLSLRNKNERSCEGCTACCEGWLSANIKGEEMFPGKPCQFVEQGVGCTIYKDRPKDPCKQFQCMWRSTDSSVMPDEFKPSEVGSIVTVSDIDGIPYHNLVECGVKPQPEVISWFVAFVVGKGLNAYWTVDGKPYWMGSQPFNAAMHRYHFGG